MDLIIEKLFQKCRFVIVCIVGFLCLNYRIPKKKKTFTKTKPVSFGNLFGLFYKYWDYTSKRGTQYSALEVLLLTNVIYMDLRSKWEKQKWDIEELNYICLALDNNYEDFDPTFYTDCRYAYLDHIKTYYLEKN